MSKEGIKQIIIGARHIGGEHIPDALPIEVEELIKELEASLTAKDKRIAKLKANQDDILRRVKYSLEKMGQKSTLFLIEQALTKGGE